MYKLIFDFVLLMSFFDVSYACNDCSNRSVLAKLNDYVLRINGEDRVNLFWVYVLITIVFVVHVVLMMRKKSRGKNDKLCRSCIKKN